MPNRAGHRGQDSKAIALFENGRVKKFEMNDRCAAGTGKFLEIMAKSLGYDIQEFGPQALLAEKDLQISSMCTVFAESEVTSLIAKGKKPPGNRQGAARQCDSTGCRHDQPGLVKRPHRLHRRCGPKPCMVSLLVEKLNRKVLVPRQPSIHGGPWGAALLAAEAG